MNQCQGCQAGWPIEINPPFLKGGKPLRTHKVVGGYPGERVLCTAYKYKEPQK